MKVSIAIVHYQNLKEVQRIINEVAKVDYKDYELILIDNNTTDEVEHIQVPKQIKQFKLFRNANIGKLAGATNQAIIMSEGKYFVYLCGTHTHINSPDWLHYMVQRLGTGAIGGTVSPYNVNGRTGMHVQGGCFIANAKIIDSLRYDEISFPFSFMDVDMSMRMLKKGHQLIDMPDIKSVMGHIKNKSVYKIYHSHT
jgi:glycosyltransferase involved in cell wall biosynthesis